MGTRGYYAYRYRGYYFVYYNHYDSYPSGLGRSFVAKIPEDKEEFDKWLEATKARFEKELARIEAEGYDAETDETYAYTPCARAPENDDFIEWVYTADLDQMVFSVDSKAHFRLDNIPRGENTGTRDWTSYISLDGSGGRCLNPSTPKAYVAEWLPPLDAPSPAGLVAYSQARPTCTPTASLLDATESSTGTPAHVLAGAVFKTVLNASFGALHDACAHPPGDARFRHYATQLLRAAAPHFGHMTLEVTRRPRTGIQHPREKDEEGEEGAGPLWFRFRNCAIGLATRLDEEQHRCAAVGEAVLHMRERAGAGTGTKTALLWSMRHVVVVQVDDNGTGQVTHSEAIPILAAYGQDDSALEDGIDLLSYYLRPAHDTPADLIPIPTPTGAGGDTTSPSASPTLPLDVIAHVVSYTDASTFDTLRLVSRATRALWARQARIGPYAIVRAEGLLGTRCALAELYCVAADNEDDDNEGEEGSQERRFVVLYFGKHPSEREELSDLGEARRVFLNQPEGETMAAFFIREEFVS